MIRRAALAVGLALLLPGAAVAQGIGRGCQPGVTDDTLRPLPVGMVDRFRQVFDLPRLPADVAQQTTVIRCVDGRVLACSRGANLPCDKADARRRMPDADAWCRQGNSGAVPAYVTGHATLYAWECRGGRAGPVRQVAQADARGFVAAYWRALD